MATCARRRARVADKRSICLDGPGLCVGPGARRLSDSVLFEFAGRRVLAISVGRELLFDRDPRPKGGRP
jgi:hypothetical protein